MTQRNSRNHRPPDDPTRTDDLDPGAFVGQRPERQASTIPGGVRPEDERIAAHSTQSSPPGGEADDARADEAGQRSEARRGSQALQGSRPPRERTEGQDT